VALEMRLVARDQLARDDVIVVDLIDAIDQQERITVRQDPFDIADVEHYFLAGAAAVGEGLTVESAPSPLL